MTICSHVLDRMAGRSGGRERSARRRAFMFVQTEVSRPAKLRRKFESDGGVPQ
jgi:hypothetical protein